MAGGPARSEIRHFLHFYNNFRGVIGVTVFGEKYAYLIDASSLSPRLKLSL